MSNFSIWKSKKKTKIEQILLLNTEIVLMLQLLSTAVKYDSFIYKQTKTRFRLLIRLMF